MRLHDWWWCVVWMEWNKKKLTYTKWRRRRAINPSNDTMNFPTDAAGSGSHMKTGIKALSKRCPLSARVVFVHSHSFSLSHTHRLSLSLRSLDVFWQLATEAYMRGRIHVQEGRNESVRCRYVSISIWNNCTTITKYSQTRHNSSPLRSPGC